MLNKRNENSSSQPSWFGFHRDGLIIVFLLDWLWLLMEFSAGATIVGVAAIPFIAFALFALSFLVVMYRQRKLGNSYREATARAFFLGFIAGFPTPIFYTILCGFFAVGNALVPKTRGVSIKFPSNEVFNVGRFTSEYRHIESLLKEMVELNGGDTVRECSNVNKCIKFLQKRQVLPKETSQALDQLRKIRNNYIHKSDSIVPDIGHIRLLKRCKEEVEAVLQRKMK